MSLEIVGALVAVLAAVAGAASWVIREARDVAKTEVRAVASLANQLDAELLQVRSAMTSDREDIKRDIIYIKELLEDMHDQLQEMRKH